MKIIGQRAGIILLILFLQLVSPELRAQSVDRIVLVEQVASASCGPCAAANPAFKTLLESNLENVAIIKYQRGGGGYVDPMWSFNPSQVDSRISGFYGVSGFPHAWMNGTYYGSPNSINQSKINDELSEPAWWDIDIEQSLNEAGDELAVSVTFTALRDFQESADSFLSAYVVVTEDEVNYATPPGYNGELDFYWVMRNMLTGSNGSLLDQQVEGQTTTLNYTYAIDEAMLNPERLRVVAFVQTMTTGEVHQAGVYREAEPSAIQEINLSPLTLQPTITDQLLSLSFSLLKPETLSLEIYNIRGQLREELSRESYSPGFHQQSFVLGDLAPGVYFAVLRGGSESRTARFIIAD